MDQLLPASPYPPTPFPRGEKGEIEERDLKRNHQVNGLLLEYARDMRKNPTKAEDYLWKFLRRNRMGVHFRRQHPLAGCILDFYCDDARLGIEVDGSIHDNPVKQEEDIRREDKLSDEKVHLLRFTNEQVLYETKKVLDLIIRYVGSPLPSGEGLGEGEV